MNVKNVLARVALMAPALLLAQTSSAGSLQRLDANHVSVHASGVPVGNILGELDGLMRLDNLFIEPAIESRVVSVNIDRVALKDAAVQILKESGLDFIVWGKRVFVGDPDGRGPARAPGLELRRQHGGGDGGRVVRSRRAAAGRERHDHDRRVHDGRRERHLPRPELRHLQDEAGSRAPADEHQRQLDPLDPLAGGAAAQP
jgi:hypothetical protein